MVIDCAVHPVYADDHFAEAIGPPWNFRKIPRLTGNTFGAPFDQVVLPGEEVTTAAGLAAHVFANAEVARAILAPTTRGYYPNPQQADAVAKAANQLVHDEWLDADDRYLGSIRVAVNDAAVAVREIERWADDERFVQIVVPARVIGTYGEQRFFPIWQAAAELGLVIFVHDELGTLAEAPPTQVGYPSFYAEAHAVRPSAGIIHLTSFIASGVVERLPELRVVFGDVSVHGARSLLLRTDKDWRSDRLEVPWVTADPTTYMERFARFVVQPEDEISPHSATTTDAIGADTSELVVYGSRLPYWDSVSPDHTFTNWAPEQRERCLSGNALAFYPRLAKLAAASPAA